MSYFYYHNAVSLKNIAAQVSRRYTSGSRSSMSKIIYYEKPYFMNSRQRCDIAVENGNELLGISGPCAAQAGSLQFLINRGIRDVKTLSRLNSRKGSG